MFTDSRHTKHYSLTRRGLLGLGAAGVTALTLGGCSGSSPMRVAWYGPDAVTKALTAALEAWKASNPIEYVTENAAFADYWDKLATQTSGNNAPDVFRMSMSYFADYASRGTLKDLAGLPINTADLDPDVASSGTYNGKMVGVGQSSISFSMFVDHEKIRASGIDSPENGAWTWQDFANYATAYAKAVPNSFGAPDAAGNFALFESFARQHGTELFSADGNALAVSEQVIAEWYEFWAKLRADKAVPTQQVSGESAGIEKSLLATGKSPIQWGWCQQATFYQPLVKASLTILPVPQEKTGDLSGQFIKGLDMWCISANTKFLEPATQVIDFMLNNETAIEAIGVSLGVPPSKKARDIIKAKVGSADATAIAYVEDIADQVGEPPAAWPPGYGELLGAFNRVAENIGFGKTTAEAGSKEFVDIAAKALAP